MTKTFTTALLAIIFFASCKTASKSFDQGNYETAIEKAVKKLEKDPADAAMQKLLQEAYRHAVAQREESIRNVLSGSSDTRYEQAYQEYRNLQDLYNTVQANPAAAKAVSATNYTSYIETYRDKAAETRMDRGMRWMDEGRKQAFREAYREFSAAQRLKPNDIEIKKWVQQSYDAAIVNVLVLPMDIAGSSYYYSNSSYQMRNFQERIIRDLNYQTSSEFVRYLSEWDARSRDVQPDEVLEMRLGRIRIGQPYERSENRKVQKRVVVKETVYSKDSVVKEWATVYATIRTTRRVLVSEAGMLLTTRDAEGRILWSDEMGGEHRWETSYVTYTGDERALSDNDKALIRANQPGDDRVPREDEIVDHLLTQIQAELMRRLRSHYGRNF